MGPKMISLIGGIPFLPGPLERSSTVYGSVSNLLFTPIHPLSSLSESQTTPLGVPRPSIPEEMDEKTLEIDCFRKLVNREFLDEYHEEYDNRHLGQGHFKGMKVYWDKNKPPIVY